MARGMLSPGPSWTVLPQPASSSPSTRTSIHSDVDMGDDEADNEPDTVQPPISKRKALSDTDSPTASARRPKQPRLDVNGTTTTSPSRHAVPSRTQPGPPPSSLRRTGVQSADSGASTSDFPSTITERIQNVARAQAREQQKQKEKGKEKGPTTARKTTVHPKNVRKVSTLNLLRDAQSRHVDPSAAWTRVRPKLKPKRTSYEIEMACLRPLAVARQRDGDVIELTDSSDSTRRRQQPSTGGVRPAGKDDPIVITSGSEDELVLPRATQWRKSGPQARVPPPEDVEVISLTDSEEDGPSRAGPSTSGPMRTRTGVPGPVPVPENAPASLSSRQDIEPSPSAFGALPEDLDDPFSNMDFGTGGDDANPVDGWDGLGTSLAAPVAVPPGDMVGTTALEGVGDAEDALFNSYLNLDQLAGDGNEEVVRAVEEEPANGPGASTREGLTEEDPDEDVHMPDLEEGEVDPNDIPARRRRSMESRESGEIQSQETGGGDAQTVSEHGPNADPHVQSLDRASARAIGTPESGEITGRGSGGEARVESERRPPSSAPPPIASIATTTASMASSSTSPRLPESQPLKRTGLVMPDISLYKGIRFKRTHPEAWENSFFSRALAGVGRPGKELVSVAERNASSTAPTSADVPSHDVEVRSQTADTNMQIDAVASTSQGIPSTPPQSPQQPAETRMVSDMQSTIQAQQLPTLETTHDGPPPSTQPAPTSIRETLFEPPATQPASSSSHPIIAPPRIPRPSTPMSLVDALNEVRRDRLLKNERQLARKRSSIDLSTGRVMPASQLASPSPAPVPPATPALTQVPPTRMIGKTPSLKDIRELLAKRNVLSPSARRPSTPNEDRAHCVPTSSVAASAPAQPASAEQVGSSEEDASRKSSVLDTSTTATTATASGSGAASTGASTKRRVAPFEAFISPVRTFKDKGKHVDGSVSPTVLRPRLSTGMLFQRRGKEKEMRSRRRESAAATFEAFIVRDSPGVTRVGRMAMDKGKGKEGEDADVDAGVGEERPVELGVQESERVVPADSVKVPDQESEADGANREDRGVVEDVTRVDEGGDETDALLELASVHLSQTHLDEAEVVPEPAEKPADESDVDMLDELPALRDGSPETNNVMVVDEPPDEDEDEETSLQIGVIDVPEIESRATTPDLFLPEDPLPSTSDQNNNFGQPHERRRSGGVDSVDECDALLASSVGCESESEESSSKTASSTSLAPPRINTRRRSPPVDLPSLVDSPALVSDDVEEDCRCEYRIVTFASRVAEERERPPEYKLAKDIPHSLQDYVNGVLPESYRRSQHAREVFEAHIMESMGNEPDAPLIKIFDNNIAEEWTPAWEFHYTNELWFGEGVPPPDRKGLVGCGCVGKCDPRSSTCLCAKRQLKWVQPYIDGDIIPPAWPGSPFVYDHKGSLQRLECPIFECNRFCACDEDCPNRVVQNGRKWPVHIVRTVNKGWGVVAGDKKIPKGSYLGIYAGELITEQEGEARGRHYDLYGRTYLFSIDFHHLKLDMENPDEWENLYVVDAYHAGNFTRFLNHSCDPNCSILACHIDDADVDKPLLAVFTTRDVEPWEELCFSYFGDMEEKLEEIAKEGGVNVRDHAVYTQCQCGADNCIGRLFS